MNPMRGSLVTHRYKSFFSDGSYALLLKRRDRAHCQTPIMIERGSHGMKPPKHNISHVVEFQINTENECYVPAGWFDRGDGWQLEDCPDSGYGLGFVGTSTL